jgi:putative hemolysin
VLPFCKGHFRARLAETPQDLLAAQRLRFRAFRAERAATCSDQDLDVDALDERCQHLLVETLSGGAVVGTCRLFLIKDVGMLEQSYAAQFYDLRPLTRFKGAMLEIGRFCIAPDQKDQDALRLAWAALTRIVDAESVALMFGCSSFPGVTAECHADALALLAKAHIGPEDRRPGRKAAEAVALQAAVHDRRQAMAQMPPLLRSYLAMGGWVSDHAVLDRDLDTLHVFTGVEIAAIPPVRARLLRDDAR